MQDNIYILSIETSCDETSMAIVKNGNEVIKQITNTQIDYFKSLGGVVPEMASRMHAQNIFYVYEELFSQSYIKIEEIDAIAVTQGPGLIGSLLVGINFAKILAKEYNKKLIAVNHMQGHIYACQLEQKMEYPHLSLILSGGHSEFVYLEEEMKFKKIGDTLDDALGECFDKIAKILELPYPGGPEIDKLSQNGEDEYDLPYPKNDNTLDFSFSGIKSAAYNLSNTNKMKGRTINKNNFAFSFQKRVMTVVEKKLKIAIDEYKPKQVSIVGGVSANSYLRNIKDINNLIIPNIKYTTDNAAMIGAAAYNMYNKKQFIDPDEIDVIVDKEVDN